MGRVGVVDLVRSEPAFRRIWLSQVVSELGDWFQIVAIAAMFPTRGGGASILAALIVVRYIVAAITSPIAGVVADRYNRGRVMIAADVARIGIMFAFFLVRGPDDVVLIFVLSTLLEATSMFFEPAKGAAIPQVLPTEKLYAANALSGATWSAMLALGALAGGAVTSLIGRNAAFGINAASFALSAFFVWRAKVPDLPPPRSIRNKQGLFVERSERKGGGARGGGVFEAPSNEKGDEPISALGNLREGIGYLREHPAQRSLLTLKSGALFSGGAFVLVTVFADQLFADPNAGLLGEKGILMGLMLAGRGTGALFTPFVMERFTGSSVRGVGRALLFAFPLCIAGFCAFSQAPGVWIAAIALVIAHGGTSTIWVGSSQLFQVTVPNHVLGRVLSVDLMLVTLSVAVINAIVAAALHQGIAPRMAALGLGLAFVLPFGAWIHAYRKHLTTLEKRS